MGKKEVEKIIDAKFKERLKNMDIPNYSIKLKKGLLEINNQETVRAGEIRYDFSSDKFCGIGAITTLHINACVHNCKIGNIFNILGIEDKIPPLYLFLPFHTRRYKFPKNEKYSGGEDFHFYSSDDLDKRINDFILPIENDIMPRIEHFLNYKMELIKDVVSCQDYYKYPFATMLITLYLNNQASPDAIREITDLAQKYKLYDLKYEEFAKKINSYFG